MKKLLLSALFLSAVFGNTLEERVKLLEEKVINLEKKLNIVNNNQKTLKKNISENTILKCNKIKLINYSYDYENGGFIKSYNFKYTLKNDYNKSIKYIYASIGFIDNDEIKLVEDYIKKSIIITPNSKIIIKNNYLIDTDTLSETLKDTPKKDIKIEFKPFKIIFKDNTILKCK